MAAVSTKELNHLISYIPSSDCHLDGWIILQINLVIEEVFVLTL